MALQLKDIGTIAKKFVSRASSASPEYGAGVSAPRVDWQTATLAANDSYKQGINESIGRDAFAKGVTKATTAKWQAKATSVGVTRYGQGVTGAADAYAAGFQKFHGVLSSLSLPPRGPKGSPNNINRVQAVADALHRAKTG